MQWVVKATKLCNLRCSYCYEWDHLNDPTRMSLEIWERVLVGIRSYAEMAEQDLGYPVRSNIIWHGGEPLLLPVSYIEDVLALQEKVFPPSWRGRRIANSVQTNLYSVSDDKLDLLGDARFRVGVSLDFIPGVRVTKGGQETEERVTANLARLKARGIPYQLITVLAGHTAAELGRVFAFIQEHNVPTRLLPLFDGPSSRDISKVFIERRELIRALMVVFDLWFRAGMTPRIRPFDAAVEAVTMKRLNLKKPRQDRRRLAHEVLVVDRNGSVSSAAHRDSWSVGDLSRESIQDMLASESYRANVLDDVTLKKQVCESCPFLGPCDTSPLSSCFDSFIARDCVVERPLFTEVEEYLQSAGLLGPQFVRDSERTIQSYARERLGMSPVPA